MTDHPTETTYFLEPQLTPAGGCQTGDGLDELLGIGDFDPVKVWMKRQHRQDRWWNLAWSFKAKAQPDVLERLLQEDLPGFASCHLPGALSGDEEAMESLIYAAPNAMRGPLALLLYLRKVPNPGWREVIRSVWNHDHRSLLASVNRKRLRAMMRRGKFPIPDLPRVVTIWRGTTALSERNASRGLSWSLNRAVACWFATRYEGPDATPLVLRSEVPRESIIFYDNERGEEEILLSKTFLATVDPDQTGWIQTGQEWKLGLDN